MNIAIFTNNYLPNPFGVSMSIESFRKEFEKQGHTVYIFAPQFKEYVDENPNVFRFPAIDLKFKGIRFPIVFPYSYKTSSILKKMKIDVIHSQHPNLLGWAAKRWAKKKNVPLIFTWHTLYDKYAHFAPLVPEKMAAWWTIGNAVRYANKADQIIVPTPSVEKIIRKWGVTNKNIVAVPTGINKEQLDNADGNSIRNKFGIEDDEILLAVVTRLTEEKNMEFLFGAVVEVLKKNHKVKFLVGGDGGLTEKLKVFVGKSNCAEQVIFAGFIPNETKRDYYAAGDIFVFASVSETQGMIISEAMYAGLPIVAVNATGVKDLVANQISGLLVKEDGTEFVNAIQKLIDDEGLRKKMAQNAQLFAKKNYTSDVSAQKMLGLYEKAILEKRGERKG